MPSLRILVCLLLALTLLSPEANAEENKWVHTRGSFERSGDANWVERARTSGDDVEYHFIETLRQDGFTEMYDESRDVYVRIYDNHLDFRCPREGKHEYGTCYHGSWEVDKLHITFVIDSNAANVGEGSVRDFINLNQVFMEAIAANREKFEGKISTSILTGDDVTPEKIRAQYASGTEGASASGHFFYYTGHGAFDPNKGRFLATSGGNITLTEIRNLLNSTGARSIVIAANCCGNIASFTPLERRRPAKWKVFNRLLFENSGIVEIHSSTEGEFSWTNSRDGSYFTSALCKLFCEPAWGIRDDLDSGEDAEVTWEDFFGRLRDETSEIFDRTRSRYAAEHEAHPEAEKHEILNSQHQIPFAKSLGNWDGQHTRKVLIENTTNEPICVWLNFFDRDYATEEWKWYTNNGQPYVYEIAPGQTIAPLTNGYRIEAKAIQLRAQSTNGSGNRWGDFSNVMLTTDSGYIGPLENKTFRVGP